MAVTLDCERIWLIRCDHPDCGRRTYMTGEDAEEASRKAAVLLGWVRYGLGGIWCTTHGGRT